MANPVTASHRLDWATTNRIADPPTSAEAVRPTQAIDQPSSLSQARSPENAHHGSQVVPKGVCVTVHAHFYQPPRENPHLDAIEQQPGAEPYHNWNERIYWESYRPNAFARVLNDKGEVVEIVNNYEYLSFNVGPTLMGWLEKQGREVYDRILAGDRSSRARLGHGNAVAQVYNHLIMPLANQADKRTQIRWGKADFRRHFERESEGMWLAETAVDAATVEALIDEGIRFIILAPSQAEWCRPMADCGSSPDDTSPWQDVSQGQIDPTRPYRCRLGSRFLDIFFYDGPISQAIGFGDLLSSSCNFAERLNSAVRCADNPHVADADRWHPNPSDLSDPAHAAHAAHFPTQLISVATDGETFGHHKAGGEKCLAYGFTREFPARGWQVTNYAHYLHHQPPTWEVRLKPVTAWSCSHGVDRWQDDCGCGGSEQFHQQWRRPLRQALDWLRDQLIPIYVAEAGRLLHKPWQARDEYIEVIADRDRAPEFLQRHQLRSLSRPEQERALQLLEMTRHTLLMYTSCGWFFEELSRPEGVQILRYAARALEIAEALTELALKANFLARLALAPSNCPQFCNGADVYQQLVQPSQLTAEPVAAHFAVNQFVALEVMAPGLHPAEVSAMTGAAGTCFYGYWIESCDRHSSSLGSLTLVVERLHLTSIATWQQTRFTTIVFYSRDSQDLNCELHCRIFRSDVLTPEATNDLTQSLLETFHQYRPSEFLAILATSCPPSRSYGLMDLLPEERHRLRRSLTQPVLNRLDQIYNRIYREHAILLKAFCRDGLEAPSELQTAAQVALSRRFLAIAHHLEQSLLGHAPDGSGAELTVVKSMEAIAQEAQAVGCKLEVKEAKAILERILEPLLTQAFEEPLLGALHGPEIRTREIQLVLRVVLLSQHYLEIPLNLVRSQELIWAGLQGKPQTFYTADVRALAQVFQVQVPG